MHTICVFCGASTGNRPDYAEAAKRTIELAAGQGARFVYGGGSSGLMGVVAEAALFLAETHEKFCCAALRSAAWLLLDA